MLTDECQSLLRQLDRDADVLSKAYQSNRIGADLYSQGVAAIRGKQLEILRLMAVGPPTESRLEKLLKS